MRRQITFVATAAFVVAAFIAVPPGCGPSGPSGGRIDIEGYISSMWGMSADAGPHGVLGSILIDGEDTSGAGHGKASVNITDKTRIWDMTGSAARRAAFEDLEVGQRVQAAFTGPVAESYPVQATAGELIIVERTGVEEVLERYRGELMSIKGVTGFGITGFEGEPAVLVYIESDDPSLKARLPSELEGYKVLTEVTGPIEALPR